MNVIHIYWNYPDHNLINLWTLIDHIQISYPNTKIVCQVDKESKKKCEYIESTHLEFIDLNSNHLRRFQISRFKFSVLFNCKNSIISFLESNKIKTITITSKYVPGIDILDTKQSNLEAIIKKVIVQLDLKKVQVQKSLNSLEFKNQKAFTLDYQDSQIGYLINVSNLEKDESDIVLNCINILLQESTNFIFLLGYSDNLELKNVNHKNCLNIVNQACVLDVVTLLKNIDVCISKKGLDSDVLSKKNKATVEIVAKNNCSLTRNSIKAPYNKLFYIDSNLNLNETQKYAEVLLHQSRKLLQNYNLNLKNYPKDYTMDCFMLDNPTLFIVSSKEDIKRLSQDKFFMRIKHLYIQKWSIDVLISIVQNVVSKSVAIIVGNLPIYVIVLVKLLRWFKPTGSRLEIVKINEFSDIGISEVISPVLLKNTSIKL